MAVEFPEDTSLSSLQVYMGQLCKERGWDQDSPELKFLLFTEEVGELAKAIRIHKKIYSESKKTTSFQLEEEFADVFSYLLDLANTLNVDLLKAFKEKEAINAKRKWK